MNRQRLIIAAAVALVLLVVGFLAWDRARDAGPTTPSTVEIPTAAPQTPVAEASQPDAPAEPVPVPPPAEQPVAEAPAAPPEAEAPAAPPEAEATAETTADAEASAPATEEEVAAAPEADTAAIDEPPEESSGPSFDALRVNESGDMIVAGQAEPGAEVVITAGEEEIGRAVAEPDGSFVVLSDKPLEPGEYTVGIESTDTDSAAPELSDDVVVLVVPERGQTIAGESATAETGGALALLTPRDSTEPSRVLQAPPSSAAPSEPLSPVPIAPGERPEVTIEVVDYDADGNVLVSGSAPAGGLLRLYFDNTLATEAYAGTDGRYTLRPIALVMPGRYTLRVDLIDASGRVLARAETPFQRTSPEELQLAEGRIVVQPGNSLWRIARNVYGRGPLYTVIFDANRTQIRDPDLIYPGQVFTVPGEPG